MSDEAKYRALRALRTDRDLAAYGVVGTATALLYFADLSGESFDKASLRDALDRYRAAEKAIAEFDKETVQP